MIILVSMFFGGFALFIFIMRLRRRYRPREIQMQNFDFQIEQLHRLHQNGKITVAEFERAKASVLSRKAVQQLDGSKRGFEVLPARQAMVQPLEDRTAP